MTVTQWHQKVCGIIIEIKYMMIHTDANNRMNKNKTVTSKSFEYKIKLRGSNTDDSNILEDLANALEAFLSWRRIPSDKRCLEKLLKR